MRDVLSNGEDAFGRLLDEHSRGHRAIEVVERDDGAVFAHDVAYYFAPFRAWWPQERQAMRWVRGRALDLGCGAGRVALHLQSRGHEVVAIDVSPLAVEVARRRGVLDARLGTVESAISPGERFDTILLLGNNAGLLGGQREGRRLLRRLGRLSTDGARLLAGSYDPYVGASAFARSYQERNRARGRMAGQERLRIRFRKHATPWYDVLFCSREELRQIAQGTGWTAARFLGDDAGYVAVLERGGVTTGGRPS